MATQRQAAVGFIFITLLIDITGLGLIIPVMPRLIMELGANSVSDASWIGGWLTFTYAIMQFIFSPVLGGLSDRFGRRPVLLLSLLGFAADYIFLAFAPSLFWLFIGRALAGITGASITTATAYIADVSTPQNRAQNFGMVGAAFGLGFIVGPVIGGLLGSFGPRIPFMVAAGLCFLNFLYGYFLLPESLTQKNRRAFDWKRANPLGSIKRIRSYQGLGGLFISLMLIYIAAHAIQSNWTFFTKHKFNWDETMIGISLGFVGVMIALVQGLLIRYINPKLGNERSVYFGLLLYALGLLLFAFAGQGWMMFVILVPYCIGGIAGPALQSLISGKVPMNEQGELQGAITSLVSLTAIIGPLVMTGLFAFFTGKSAPIEFPGAPFLLASILMLISALVANKTLKHQAIKTGN